MTQTKIHYALQGREKGTKQWMQYRYGGGQYLSQAKRMMAFEKKQSYNSGIEYRIVKETIRITRRVVK